MNTNSNQVQSPAPATQVYQSYAQSQVASPQHRPSPSATPSSSSNVIAALKSPHAPSPKTPGALSSNSSSQIGMAQSPQQPPPPPNINNTVSNATDGSTNYAVPHHHAQSPASYPSSGILPPNHHHPSTPTTPTSGGSIGGHAHHHQAQQQQGVNYLPHQAYAQTQPPSMLNAYPTTPPTHHMNNVNQSQFQYNAANMNPQSVAGSTPPHMHHPNQPSTQVLPHQQLQQMYQQQQRPAPSQTPSLSGGPVGMVGGSPNMNMNSMPHPTSPSVASPHHHHHMMQQQQVHSGNYHPGHQPGHQPQPHHQHPQFQQQQSYNNANNTNPSMYQQQQHGYMHMNQQQQQQQQNYPNKFQVCWLFLEKNANCL
jgi:hypothetical protein